MDKILSIVVSVIADSPAIVAAVKTALEKRGFSNAEIEAIFADVIPYDQLGIDPNHPVAPEPTAPAGNNALAPVDAPAPPPVPLDAPHTTARTKEQAAALAPKLPTAQPPPNPFERAR